MFFKQLKRCYSQLCIWQPAYYLNGIWALFKRGDLSLSHLITLRQNRLKKLSCPPLTGLGDLPSFP